MIDEIDPALAAGLPVAPLATRFAVVELESAVLVVVGGARFTPSLTDALGRAEAEDFSEVTDSGRGGTAGGDFAPAAALLETTVDEAVVGFGGTTEARREGGGGAALVEGFLAGGGILVLDPGAGAALDVFLIVEVADVGLVAVADDEATFDPAAGAAFTEPAPNVPELRTCVIRKSEMK